MWFRRSWVGGGCGLGIGCPGDHSLRKRGRALSRFRPGIVPPPVVGGKEYSHDADSTTVGAVASPPPFDAEQIIAWDGSGGTVDVTDFTGTRPSYTPDDQIDAMANHGDFAYNEVKKEIAHLVFSVDDRSYAYTAGLGAPPVVSVVPSAGPIVLPIGSIGGAGELSYELGTAFGAMPSTVGTWATQKQINGSPFPDDIDGVELWGPEPPSADTDKYSLDTDILSGGAAGAVSVWNASGSPYILHSEIFTAVASLLGTSVEPQQINLDALMVHDVYGDPNRFDKSTDGSGGDEIIFSIRQIPDRSVPGGYYATGSELFVLNATLPAAFLSHGGHLWDRAYALTAFDVGTPNSPHVLDVNALEAIGESAVPEPSSLVLALIGLLSWAVIRRGS